MHLQYQFYQIFLCFTLLLSIPHAYLLSTEIVPKTEAVVCGPKTLKQEIHSHQKFFSDAKKEELIEHLIPYPTILDEKILFAGFLQCHVATSDEITPEEKATYLWKKTIKAALKNLECILATEKIYEKELVLNGWNKLYMQLKWFTKSPENMLYFTSHIQFNLLFLFTLLNDIGHNRSLNHVNKEELLKKAYTYFDSIIDVDKESDNTKMFDYLKVMNTVYNPLINLFERPGIKYATLAELKKYFDQKDEDTVILSIVNKNGIGGIFTFAYFLSKGKGLVGSGLHPSEAHGRSYRTISRMKAHDGKHMSLWVNQNTSSLDLSNDLKSRKQFLNRTDILLTELIQKYNEAKIINNKKIVRAIYGDIVICFYMLHENGLPYKIFEKTAEKDNFTGGIKVYLQSEKIATIDDNNIINPFALKQYLFNAIDMHFLLKYHFFKINIFMNEHHLKIKKSCLINLNNGKTTGKDLKIFVSMLEYRMNKIGKHFIQKYADFFEGMLPYIIE